LVLVDSSIWIHSQWQRIPVASLLPDDEVVAVCPIIVQEVLRGTRNAKHYAVTRGVLLATQLLDSPTPFERFEEAAGIFLACRDTGITPRSSVDCLIAATAIAHRIPLFHNDRDFGLIARAIPELHVLTPSSGSRS
jgi:predicted nucleic acid-binding protein